MPHAPSSSAKRPSRHRAPPPAPRSGSKKELAFGPVEIISDSATPKSSRSASAGVPRSTGGKLRRSPTPVLTSLTELTNAHLTQLSKVWHEQNLPTFESDKKSIAATRNGKADPFDF